eukprot:g1981.t1
MPDQELEAPEVELELAAAKARHILDNHCDKYFQEKFQSIVNNSLHSESARDALSFMARMKCHCDLGEEVPLRFGCCHCDLRPADKAWFSKWLKEAKPFVLQQFKTPEVVDPSAATQQKGPALEVGQAQGVGEGRALVLPSSSSSSLPRAGGRKEDKDDEPVVLAAGPPRLGVNEASSASSVRASVGNERRGEVSVQVALGRIKQATAEASARRRKNGISDEDELENEAAAVLELSPQLQVLKAEISQYSSGAGSQALAQKLDGLLTDANRMAKTIQTIRFVHPDKFAFHEQNSKRPGEEEQPLEFTQEDLKEAFQTVDTAVATLTAFTLPRLKS